MAKPGKPDPPTDDLGWRPDAPATDFLLGRGQIERVEPNPSQARMILGESAQAPCLSASAGYDRRRCRSLRHCVRRRAKVVVRDARGPRTAYQGR